MQKPRTHYDNLKVARNAPQEVIRAAYKTLTQKYHPDRNPDPSATRIMSLLNEAYEVLSDPSKRREHDAWIESAEQDALDAYLMQKQAEAERKKTPPPPSPPPAPPPEMRSAQSTKNTPVKKRARSWFVIILTCLLTYWALHRESPSTQASRDLAKANAPKSSVTPAPLLKTANQSTSAAPATAAVKPRCVVPATDPRGQAWPTKAGYLNGFPMSNSGGLSEITVDNSSSDESVYAKISDTSGKFGYRHAFIPGHGKFTFSKLDAGTYQLRYKTLSNGCGFASSAIRLAETPVGNQVQYSVYSITLFKVRNGNAQFSNLLSDDF